MTKTRSEFREKCMIILYQYEIMNTGKTKINKLIVFRDNPPHNGGMPCGACREYLMQLSKNSKNIEILVDRENKNVVNIEELIPDWWGYDRV